MESTRTFSDKILLVVKGIAMGAANKVPGVSGGVVAFVAGFYEEFIYSLQKFNYKAFLLLINGRIRSFFQYINFKFIFLLILGMVISYFSVSKILDYLIEQYELYVWSTFFGMIIGSIYYMSRGFRVKANSQLVFLLGGTLVGILISFLEPATQNDNLFFVFICGIISVSGMTLPGLSGSFILILLGNYVLLLVDSVNALYDTISDIVQWDFSFTEDVGRLRLLKILTVFTAGSVFGLVSLSHVLGYVLKRYRATTFATIIGFITGSLGVVWPWKTKIYEMDSHQNIILDANAQPIIKNYSRYLPELNDWSTWISLVFILFGILIVLYLVWLDHRKKTKRHG